MIKSLTILIPAYNEENLIGKMLHSILNQSMLEEVSVNVIILVNGSSDNTFNITQKILQSFSKKLFSWKVVNIERRGKTNALNVGLKMSKDEIIICVDSDCYLEKNAIFQIYNNLTKYSKYIIIGGIDIPDFKNISTSTMLYEFQKVQQIYREERSRIIPVGRLMGFKKNI